MSAQVINDADMTKQFMVWYGRGMDMIPEWSHPVATGTVEMNKGTLP